MKSEDLLKKIKTDLTKNVDPKYVEMSKRFYKKGEFVGTIGVRIPIVRKISARYFPEVKNWPKEKIFAFCETLLKTKTSSTIAFDWAYRIRKQYKPNDFKIFESWLKQYVNSWSKCDDFCCRALGYLIYIYPTLIHQSTLWAKSKNRWLRRASAVTLIYSVRKKQSLKNVFDVADKLLLDKDDLVQKGYGWMLKEASNLYQKQVYEFVIKRKNKMPRTALRYAIEKMPKEMRSAAMKK